MLPPAEATRGGSQRPGTVQGSLLAAIGGLLLAVASPALAAATASPDISWWIWPLALFAVCVAIGVVAIPAGIGGGVLFVPIVSGFFPFHLDFVRGAGLMVALASALAAGPSLLRGGLADLRVALPLALVASIASIGGAVLGLALPTPVVQTALGITILAIAILMLATKRSESPALPAPDRLSSLLSLHGVFHDAARAEDIRWQAHRTPQGLALFCIIGVLAGMFGLGAGWANVPVLNLVMGMPLKASAGTSSFILSLVDSAAAWIYLHNGAVLALVVVPSVAGMIVGARIGVRALRVMHARTIRWLVIALLLFAGGRALIKGVAAWG